MLLSTLIVAAMGTSAQAGVLDDIKSDGKLTVCFAQGMPDNYKNPTTGEWNGVMVDLVHMLADWIKVEVEPIEVGWDVAVLSLKQGTCDLFGSSIVYNAPRAMEINYVAPFGAKGINVVMSKDNPKELKTPADMNSEDFTLVAELGTREQETAQRLFPKANIIPVKVQSSIQIVDHVKRGDADAAVLPAITVKWWLQVPENAEWGKMGFPGQDFGNAPNGWAVRYGDPDWKSFLDAFSNYVAANNISLDLYEEYMARTNPFIRSE
ncbi:MAG TPA: transporter substrate-binding domain-containing protein [Geminicoccaceae bacterium]|nr:transporter substrate-binding domain-containing protein [Geminicoccaceae bacterium]